MLNEKDLTLLSKEYGLTELEIKEKVVRFMYSTNLLRFPFSPNEILVIAKTLLCINEVSLHCLECISDEIESTPYVESTKEFTLFTTLPVNGDGMLHYFCDKSKIAQRVIFNYAKRKGCLLLSTMKFELVLRDLRMVTILLSATDPKFYIESIYYPKPYLSKKMKRNDILRRNKK